MNGTVGGEYENFLLGKTQYPTGTESYESDDISTILRDDEEVDCLCLIKQCPGQDKVKDKIRRSLPEKAVIKVGRLAGKLAHDATKTDDDHHIWLTSKVISRSHAEIWKSGGIVYIRDLGSSSGTFLNKVRLSPSGQVSRHYPLRSDDMLQLGIDYKWKNGEMYQCVLFRVRVERRNFSELQAASYRRAMFSQALNSLIATMNPNTTPSCDNKSSVNSCQSVECCLCLSTFGPSQAIFIAPCSHCYHYRCIYQVLLQGIMFQCPMCRQYANMAYNVSMDSLSLAISDSVNQDHPESQAEVSLPTPFAHRLPMSTCELAFVITPNKLESRSRSVNPHANAASGSHRSVYSENSPLSLTAGTKDQHRISNTNVDSSSTSILRNNTIPKYLKLSRSIPDKISNILKWRLCNTRVGENANHT